MRLHKKFYLLAALGLIATSVANAADQQGPGGFLIGGSFEAAQRHAFEREWKLVPLSDRLPGHWVVEETNLSLFVCNGIVASIIEQLEGDLEEFTALVFALHMKFGEPDIQVSHLPSGGSFMSTIDARFDKDIGGTSVQLQSFGGDRNFSRIHWGDVECN